MHRKLLVLGSFFGLIGIILGQIADTWGIFLYSLLGLFSDMIWFAQLLGLTMTILSGIILLLTMALSAKSESISITAYLCILVMLGYVLVYSFSLRVYVGSMPILSPFFVDFTFASILFHSIGILLLTGSVIHRYYYFERVIQ